MKRVIIAVVLLSLWACAPNEDKPVVETKKEAQIVKSFLTAYPLTDSLLVNSVEAVIYNGGIAGNYQYAVTLVQGSEAWSDTVTFYMSEGDTARKQIIFAESWAKMSEKAAFTAKLNYLEEK